MYVDIVKTLKKKGPFFQFKNPRIVEQENEEKPYLYLSRSTGSDSGTISKTWQANTLRQNL